MPHLMKAIISFPKWGLKKDPDLQALIEAELYSDDARFTIPDDYHETCRVIEQACFARFSNIEHALKRSTIPYDVVFKLPNKNAKTQRSWRPGPEGELEFQVQDEPAVLTNVLRGVIKQYPDTVPSSVLRTLCFDVENQVTALSLWESEASQPEIERPQETNENNIAALLDEITLSESDLDLDKVVHELKDKEAETINRSGKQSQLAYLSQILGFEQTKRLIKRAVNASSFKPK